jgi:hypothetical protein
MVKCQTKDGTNLVKKKSNVPGRTGEPVEAYTLQNTLVVNHPRDNKAERRGE